MKPIYVKKNGEVNKISGIVNPSSYSADDITYDGSTSGLTADDVQEAIDEIVDGLGTAASKNVGVSNGVAELDSSGKVPSSQLPSYVDDVIEVDDYSHLPITGESGKIYVTRDTSLEYRWSGTTYVQISKSLALGETSETAYRGDRGKTAYDHATETKLSTATASGLYKVAATAQGHIASLTAVIKDDITGLGISDENVKQSPSTDNATYEVLLSGSADNTEHTEGVKKSNKLTFNPSTGTFIQGDKNSAVDGGHAEGYKTSANGSYSHTEGFRTIANEQYSHAEGYDAIANGKYSHAEGQSTTSSGQYSHAEGYNTSTKGNYSHAEGSGTSTKGSYSHAEGYATIASAQWSHAEGYSTTADGLYSHAEGICTSAAGEGQLVIGQYNDPDDTSLFIIGNGTDTTRSNAMTVDATGNLSITKINGVTVGNSPKFTDTDTKVTSVGNHYTPTCSGTFSASASGATAAWSIDVVKGVTLQKDAAGHITGVSVTSGKIPANPNTDTKVTSVGNHYTPTCSGTFSANASGATAAWSIDVVKGVTLEKDAAGHITGVSVTSGKIPANPNTDTKVTSVGNHYTPTCSGTFSKSASGGTAAWSVDVVTGITLQKDAAGHIVDMSITSGKTAANPVPSNNITGSGTSGYIAKFNGTNTITNGPQLGSSTSTYLRNDGSWATPTDTNTHRPIQVNGTEILGNNTTALNLKAGSNVSLSNSSGTVTIAATDTNNRKSFYGTCDTAAATAAKVVTLADTAGWELKAGTIVGVKFTNSNSASNVTLNINGSGNKSIFYDNGVYTGSTSWIAGQAGKVIFYMYDGTYWAWMNFNWHSDGNNAVTQNATTTNAAYEVLFSGTADNTTRTEGVRKNNNLTYNPSNGMLNAPYYGSDPTINARLTSLNFTGPSGAGTGKTMTRFDLVGADVATGAPPADTNKNSAGYVQTYYWDNSANGANAMSQIYVPNGDHISTRNGPQGLMIRGQDNGAWNDWVKIPFFTAGITSGQVLVSDGTMAGIKSSGYTIAKSVPSNAVFTDANVTQTATTTNANYEVLFSATADNTTRTETARKNSNLCFNPSTGILYGTNEMRSRDLSVSTNNGTSGGISLYSSSSQMDNYGLYFRATSNKEKHGYIQGDWATYFTMNDQDNRGWIFRRNKTGGNVASIDTKGQAVFNGSVTIGGNAANTSGARLEFNSNTNAIDFIFN